MGQLKRNAISAEHPAQIADVARSMSGLEASPNPYVPGPAEYLPTHEGEPASSIPIPGIEPSDYDVPAINSPQGMAQFALRSLGREPKASRRGPVVEQPHDPEWDAQASEPTMTGNYVLLDESFAQLDGQMIPLSDMDIDRIQGIIIRALDHKLREDLKRVRETYKLHTSKPKRKAVPKTRRRGRKAVPTTPAEPPSQPTESES